MNLGKDFEEQIKDSIIKYIELYLRIPDPPQSFEKTARFSNKNPYDFIAYKFPYIYAIENKTTDKPSISFSLDKEKTNVSIKYHQIMGLLNAWHCGAFAGFLINFRHLEETYFLHIYDFFEIVKKNNKHSINVNDIKNGNGLLIPQTKKRVKYNFDFSKMIDYCTNTYDKYKELGIKIKERRDK